MVGFWQLDLGTLADAYTLWLLSHDEWCQKPRCKIAHALRNAVAHSEEAGEKFPWVPGVDEWRPGGLWYFKVKLDDSFPRMRTPRREKVIGWTRELYGGDEIDLIGRVTKEELDRLRQKTLERGERLGELVQEDLG